MQSRQDRQPPSSRPSLLGTPDPQDDGDRQRLLAGLDAGAAPPPRADKPRPRRRAAWLAGLAVLVAGGSAVAWMDGAPEQRAAVVVAPMPEVRAPAEAPEVSTAAILNDTAAADEKPAAVAAPRPASKADTSALTALLESKPETPREAAPPPRLAVREHAKKKAEQHPLARNVLAKKAPAPEIDSDVALLAALVAHAKVAQRAAPEPDARKLKQCKARATVAEAEACRARLCTGSAKNSAACRPASVAQVVDAS